MDEAGNGICPVLCGAGDDSGSDSAESVCGSVVYHIVYIVFAVMLKNALPLLVYEEIILHSIVMFHRQYHSEIPIFFV